MAKCIYFILLFIQKLKTLDQYQSQRGSSIKNNDEKFVIDEKNLDVEEF